MESLSCWLQSSLKRVYPATPALSDSTLRLLSARNESISFQACVRNASTEAVTAKIAVTGPDDVRVRVRRVGYVTVAHHSTATEAAELEGVGRIPGYVPDPLFPEDTATIGPMETHAFWINVDVPSGIAPGAREIKLSFTVGEETLPEMTANVDVRSLVIERRHGFPVVHWFYADAICDWYKVAPYEEKFWEIVAPYMKDLVDHGSGQYVPIFTPPTDGIKRPHQLIKISIPSEGKYEFDFSDVRRWVHLAQSQGQDFFQWTHFFWQWGCAHALRIYRDNADPESLLWPFETPATSDIYRNFLAQFLPEFHKFLAEENLLEKSIFHVSDEPHGDEHLENYKKARAMLKDLAPWMKVADALSDIRYGREGITDMAIPSIGVAREYRAEGIPSYVYFCCGPKGKYLNRFLDTPLAKIRMSGWLFYHLDAKGFLHWGYNYWYKSQTQQLIDPFVEQAGGQWPGWSSGDTFVVYPGANGPLDSIRWEVFAESLQDFALLQTAGISKDDPLLADLKDYDDFPKNEDWIKAARERILRG